MGDLIFLLLLIQHRLRILGQVALLGLLVRILVVGQLFGRLLVSANSTWFFEQVGRGRLSRKGYVKKEAILDLDLLIKSSTGLG
jgi:hypothetical protein